MKVTFSSAASYEYAQACAYFRHIGRGDLAAELEAEIDKSIRDLQADPDLHPEILPGIRSWRTGKKFGWRVGYEVYKDEIFILAIYVSTAQEDPLYWLGRTGR